MDRRQFLRGLLGGAAVLSTVQAESIRKMLEPLPKPPIYGVTEPEFVGKIPVRQELQVLPADAPKKLAMGWRIEENIGIGVYNTSTPEERRERADRHQAWLDSLPDDYDHEQHIHLCSDRRVRAIHETRGQQYSSLEIANSPPDPTLAVYQWAPAVDTITDLPDTDPEQTVRVVQDTLTSHVRVEGLGWVQLAA
jgi:hypothetical protein